MKTVRSAACALAALGAGLLRAPATARADVHVVDFFPEEPTNGNTVQLRFIGPAEGTVTSTRLVITFTTQNGFRAEDLLVGLVVPVTPDDPEGGFWFISGEDLGWSGEGTFSADVSTAMVNGTLNPGLWGFELGSVNDPPAYAGGFSMDTRFELTIVPAPAAAALAGAAGVLALRRRRPLIGR